MTTNDYDYVLEFEVEKAWKEHLTGATNSDFYFPTKWTTQTELTEELVAADALPCKYIVFPHDNLEDIRLLVAVFKFHYINYKHWKKITELSRAERLFILKREVE